MKDLKAMLNHVKQVAPVAPAAPSSSHFGEFTGLKHFEVSEDNEDFAEEDGILLDKEKKTLIAFPSAREDEEIVIPEGIETIAPHAFDNCVNIKKIELPESVKEIGKGAFENCKNLEEVVLPEDIQVIEEETFKGAEKLKKINKPEKLEVIKEDAFDGCENLDEETEEIVKKHSDRVYGDVTKDKKIDVTDLSVMALTLIGDQKLDEEALSVADVADDGSFNLADIATLKRHIAGYKEHLGPAAVKDVLAEDTAEEAAE